jgi:hypothetical protein
VPNPDDRDRTSRRALAQHISPRPAFLLVAIVLAAASRLFPHPANFTPVTAAILLGSCVYFVVTNAACRAFWYPRTVAGLVTCHVAALPFFKSTGLGHGLSIVGLFSTLAPAERLVAAVRKRRPFGTLSPAT